jgi:hypothetical protein
LQMDWIWNLRESWIKENSKGLPWANMRWNCHWWGGREQTFTLDMLSLADSWLSKWWHWQVQVWGTGLSWRYKIRDLSLQLVWEPWEVIEWLVF